MQAPDWIAVDWGTTHLRAWAMQGADVLTEAHSDQGMGKLERHQFEPALLALVEGWLGQGLTPVLACGMVGARQGWQEAPYRSVPCGPVDAADLVRVEINDPRLDVRIVAGLAQPDPADVMRGEEVQIAGFLSQQPEFEGLILLPGTHSKHVWIKGGTVTRFSTHMTGELFALLCQHSILRHSVTEGAPQPDAFAHGVRIGADGQALATLFSIRASGLVGQADPVAERARLSGLLIGAELADVPADTPVTVIGSGALTDLYLAAAAQTGLNATAQDGANLVLAGLTQIYLQGAQ